MKRVGVIVAATLFAAVVFQAAPGCAQSRDDDSQTRAQAAEELRKRQARRRERLQVYRPVVRGKRGAIAAGTPLVTEAGMRLFHSGGNAVDAGVAAMFAGAVSEFSHFGFGGEAPLLIRLPDGRVFSIAGVGTAPQLMTRSVFLGEKAAQDRESNQEWRRERDGPIPSYGILPALVPGMVDAGLLALREFGTLSFREVAQPATDLAHGMPLDEMRARSIYQAQRFLEGFPTSMAVFKPGGNFLRPGEILHQPDLARTLEQMMAAEDAALKRGANREAAIDAVRNFFYRGEIAHRISEFVEENDGLLRYDDMASFRLELEEPEQTSFADFEVYKSGFWTQSPVMLEALNLLEQIGITSEEWNSAKFIHGLVESLKLAYADRDTWYADPNFYEVPRELLTKEYAAERAKLIDPARASKQFRPGRFGDGEPPHPSRFPGQIRPLTDALAARDTTCVNVIDKSGLMFSATPSGAWMPSVIAGDTGIPLTQRAQSFLIIPEHPNVVKPRKRPRITLSPTIVTRRGQPYLALSTPGGDQQDQSLLQVMLAAMLYRLNAQAAVEAPRIQTRHLVSSFDDHAMDPNLLLVDERIPEEIVEELVALGHEVERRSKWNSGSAPVAIKRLPNGVLEAGADPYGYRYADAW